MGNLRVHYRLLVLWCMTFVSQLDLLRFGAKGFGLNPLREAACQHGVGQYNRGAQCFHMALEFKKKRNGNADGNLFVDASCMDCDACRWIAPMTFTRYGLGSIVKEQPTNPNERNLALKAMITCPGGSIRMLCGDPNAKKVLNEAYPAVVDESELPGVYHLGFHTKAGGGTTPYLIVVPQSEGGGAVMVNVPRYSSRLANRIIDVAGGPPTHVILQFDEVAEYTEHWLHRFPGMLRIMHHMDVRPGVHKRKEEMYLVDDYGPWNVPRNLSSIGIDAKNDQMDVIPGLQLLFSPGFSPGSISLLYRPQHTQDSPGALFSGRLVGYSRRLNRLDGWSRENQVGIKRQAMFMRYMAEQDFLWLLPSRGPIQRFTCPEERHTALLGSANEFEKAGCTFI